MSRKIIVEGVTIHIEKINQADYISLTDIAKKSTSQKPATVIQSWLRNTHTIRYLFAWEKLHNDKIKVSHLADLLESATDQRIDYSPQRWIEDLNAIGIQQRVGRGGGTYAQEEIALDFCFWISPEFKVYLYNELLRLKREEFERKNLVFHVKRITDSIDEARNWLDTIPGQDPTRNRLNYLKDKFGEEE